MEVLKYSDVYFDEVDKILYETFNVNKSRVVDEKAHEFVAVEEGCVLGYFILNEMLDIIKNIKIFHVDYVCVSPNSRGRGVGKKMMEFAIEYSKKNGCSRMELTSGNKREVAHKLYLSLGFVKRDSSIFRKELV